MSKAVRVSQNKFLNQKMASNILAGKNERSIVGLGDESYNLRYFTFGLKILEKLLGSRFFVDGIENIPNHPTIYAANHFTRSETVFIPYLINKLSGRNVRCLGDSSLFFGPIGKFLQSTGTISTKDPNRDNIIMGDLVTGKWDWMIYPEGAMIKNKEINPLDFILNTPGRIGSVRTGIASIALKSEFLRDEVINAYDLGDMNSLLSIENQYGVSYNRSIRSITTNIVPINITYYPIRPGSNGLNNFIHKLVKRIPKQIAEEIEVETNLLLNAEIHITFGKSINLASRTAKMRSVIKKIPVITQESRNQLLMQYFRIRLTQECMVEVYNNTQINFDHIFSAAIFYSKDEVISIDRLKRIIYLSSLIIKDHAKYKTNSSILEENLVKMFWDEGHEAFDSAMKLACDTHLIKVSADQITINKSKFDEKYDFHQIRIENTLQVIFNEFALLPDASSTVKNICTKSDAKLSSDVFSRIYEVDVNNFEEDYSKYFNSKFSKPKSVGAPFFMGFAGSAAQKISKTGVLICHGYKAAPKEIEDLAKFLNGFGFRIYGVRLKGHGTAPLNMKDITYHDWYASFQRGYAALSNICSKVIVIGFSTGGLLTLLSAANKNSCGVKKIPLVISINAALQLRDIRARMVRGVDLWNEMLSKFSFQKPKFEYVDDVPENPDINYNRNYIKGVVELRKLMSECESNLHKISLNTLIIQADNDPIVHPKSGKIIFKKMKHQNKVLIEPPFSNHVIITGKNKEDVFSIIGDYLHKAKIV